MECAFSSVVYRALAPFSLVRPFQLLTLSVPLQLFHCRVSVDFCGRCRPFDDFRFICFCLFFCPPILLYFIMQRFLSICGRETIMRERTRRRYILLQNAEAETTAKPDEAAAVDRTLAVQMVRSLSGARWSVFGEFFFSADLPLFLHLIHFF